MLRYIISAACAVTCLSYASPFPGGYAWVGSIKSQSLPYTSG